MYLTPIFVFIYLKYVQGKAVSNFPRCKNHFLVGSMPGRALTQIHLFLGYRSGATYHLRSAPSSVSKPNLVDYH